MHSRWKCWAPHQVFRSTDKWLCRYFKTISLSDDGWLILSAISYIPQFHFNFSIQFIFFNTIRHGRIVNGQRHWIGDKLCHFFNFSFLCPLLWSSKLFLEESVQYILTLCWWAILFTIMVISGVWHVSYLRKDRTHLVRQLLLVAFSKRERFDERFKSPAWVFSVHSRSLFLSFHYFLKQRKECVSWWIPSTDHLL